MTVALRRPGLSLVFTLLVALAARPAPGQDPPPGYYTGTESLSGSALRARLHDIIKGHTVRTYESAHDWIDVLDEDPADPNRVMLIYSTATALKSTWPKYNREHVWPQSLGALRRPARSDMHHIFAADANVNSSRNNKPYDDCPGDCSSHAEAPDAFYTSTSWEPPDEDKGDIARALFYMDVRYEGDDDEPDLELIDGTPTNGCDCMGQLQTLKAWNLLDPVDDRERHRNDVIFTEIQGNRNPFVDHPEWVLLIWGAAPGAPASAPSAPAVATSTTAPGETQVRLRSSHPLGVPLHSMPGGSNTYDRVPNGTVAVVDETANDGKWLFVRVPPSLSGWIARKYVEVFIEASAPLSGPGGGEPMIAHFIDAGQADATLLEFPCGVVLIDAGAQDADHVQALIGYLNDVFTRRTDLDRTIEAVFITHNHVDHTRALREVIEAFHVRRLIENGQRGKTGDPGDTDVKWAQANATSLHLGYLDVDDGDVVSVAGRTGFTNDVIDPISCTGTDPGIRILSAERATDPGWPSGDFDDKNNHSLVIRVDYGAASLLFTGDLEEPAIETLVDFYAGTPMLDVDVYQVGHHGSYNGTTWSLMEATTPRMAVISMSAWTDHGQHTAWKYGHPRDSAIRLLEDGIFAQRTPRAVAVATGVETFFETTITDAIYATGWEGTVRVSISPDGGMEVLASPF